MRRTPISRFPYAESRKALAREQAEWAAMAAPQKGMTIFLPHPAGRPHRFSPVRCRTLWRTVVALLFLALMAADAAQQFPPGDHPWHAQWITSADVQPYEPSVLHFQRTFHLHAKPGHFLVRVSADNAFLLHVNGILAGRGPARGDLNHWRFETFDIGPLLHEGDNTLASTVWNFAQYRALAQITCRTAFVLAVPDEFSQIADTGDSWLVEVDRGISVEPVTPSLLPDFYASEPIEQFREADSDAAWDQPAPASSFSWAHSVPLGNAVPRGTYSRTGWQLVPDVLPPMESTPQPGGKVVRYSGIPAIADFPGGPVTIPAHANVDLLLDNGELTTAYPELSLEGGDGAAIRMTYAEALKDAEGRKGNRNEIGGKTIAGVYDDYTASSAPRQVFAPLVWRTWRYLQIDIRTADQPLRLLAFRSVFSAFPLVERARLTCGDPGIDKIWEISWRTLRLDAHDTYMDTPYWERLQYIGDSRIEALLSYSMAGDDRLAREALSSFDDSRLPEGITFSRYPTTAFQVIPPFSLLWIGMLHDFALYRDDPSFVRQHLPGSRAVLAWFVRHLNENGLVGSLPWWSYIDNDYSGSDFVRGVPPQDGKGDSTIITLHFIAALREAAELESAYGDESVARRYRLLAARAAHAIQALCWDRKYRLFADTPAGSHFSQHANLMAVLLDVAPSGLERDMMKRILTRELPGRPPIFTVSYYYSFYLAQALAHAGMGDQYLSLLDPWRDMMALGLTTWAEQREPTRSDSHAWSAHPAFNLLNIVAGIRPASLGFRSVQIAPHPGSLENLDVRYPHPQGEITVQWARESRSLHFRIHLPPTLPGTFVWHGRSYPIAKGMLDLTVPQP
jgi:alpha-L-rhamnosidase